VRWIRDANADDGFQSLPCCGRPSYANPARVGGAPRDGRLWPVSPRFLLAFIPRLLARQRVRVARLPPRSARAATTCPCPGRSPTPPAPARPGRTNQHTHTLRPCAVRPRPRNRAPFQLTILPHSVQPCGRLPGSRPLPGPSPWPAARHVVHVPFARAREPDGLGSARCPKAETNGKRGRQRR
jgi:hypothetical protein